MITKDNIGYMYPQIINNDLLKEKGFNIYEDNFYFKLLNRYKIFLEQYLKEKLCLDLIDENLEKSPLGFEKIKDEDKDFYQKTSTMGLNYIYLRNNIYIEHLKDEDIEFLSKQSEYNDTTKEFIKRTCVSVINPYEDNKIIFYGPENQKHICDSTDIVLGIRYDEFATKGMSDDEFQKNFVEKMALIGNLIELISVVSEQEIGHKVKLIQYNSVSILKGKENIK